MIKAGQIKLTQIGVPNTCFVIIRAIEFTFSNSVNSKDVFISFPGPFNFRYEANSRVIQSSDDIIPLASAFGWKGTDNREDAMDFLLDNLGKVVDDPGYFEQNLLNSNLPVYTGERNTMNDPKHEIEILLAFIPRPEIGDQPRYYGPLAVARHLEKLRGQKGYEFVREPSFIITLTLAIVERFGTETAGLVANRCMDLSEIEKIWAE